MWWKATLLSVVVLLAAWFVLLSVLFVARPDRGSLSDGARVLPDTLRLVRRLATDRAVPRSARGLLWLLIVYLASPVDLVPDFVPVIGYIDDLIITSLVLRHLIQRAGPERVRSQWLGSSEGLATLGRFLRIDAISQ
jgi:uncharacterized membrane protein YkvA (DUF1232 family)